jgi:hypothetical protein
MQFLDTGGLFPVFLLGSMVVFLVLGFLLGHYESKLDRSSRRFQYGILVILAMTIGFISIIYFLNSPASMELLLIIGELLFVVGYVLSYYIWKLRRRSDSGLRDHRIDDLPT